jgi:murein L,D-transpeptidase YafK
MKNKLKLLSYSLIYAVLACSFVAISYYLFPERKLPKDSKIDIILVEKSNRQMHVYTDGKKLKTYSISLGFRPKGKKHFEKDGKTPEGVYYIISKNSRSVAHKSLGISYPNAADKKYAARRGKSPGGHIMIHGLMNGLGYWGKFHRFVDWTGGCIAITDSEMDDLFRHVDVGCKIEIVK